MSLPRTSRIAGLAAVTCLAVGGAASATTSGIAHLNVHPGSSLPGATDSPSVSAVSPTDAWAVGWAPKGAVVEHWDGSAWTATRALEFLNAIEARTADDVWAVGSKPARIAAQHWDGTSWSRSPMPNIEGALEGVDAVSAHDAWAVGYKGNGPRQRTLIEHWDGRLWSRQVSDPPGDKGNGILYAVKALSPSDAWAIGYRGNNSIVEHWDGQSWLDVTLPHPGHRYDVESVSATGSDDVWLVGALNVGSKTPIKTLAMHWDGASWTVTKTPPEPAKAYFSDVDAISSDDVWAVGQAAIAAGDPYRTLIEHWDGTSWEKVPCPNPSKTRNNLLESVSADSTSDAWAVGTSYSKRHSRSTVLHWDGRHWTE